MKIEFKRASVQACKRNNLVIILLTLALWHSGTGALFSKEVGGYAGDVWRFGAGARSLGLANAMIELADDATAGYWNPARLTHLDTMNLNVLHASLFEGAAYDYLGYAYPTVGHGVVGTTLVRHGISGVESRDTSGLLTGSFDFLATGVGVSYGTVMTSKLSMGGNLRLLQREMFGYQNSLTSADFALDYALNRWAEVGFVARDVFYVASGTDDQLPLNMVFGASYAIADGALRLSAQFEQLGSVLRAGMEYGFGPVALRFGLDPGISRSFASGVGFGYQNFQLDYAINLHELGNSHRFSLGVFFGASRQEDRGRLVKSYSTEAIQAYRQGVYLKALDYIEKAIRLRQDDKSLVERRERIKKVIAALRLRGQELAKPAAGASIDEKAKHELMVRRWVNYIESQPKAGQTAFEKMANAERYFSHGSFELTLRACEELIESEPYNALAWERLGSAYFAMGYKEKALEHWKKALDLNPGNQALQEFMQRFK